MCAIYAFIGIDAIKVTGILRSAQNDSIVQDPIDQYIFRDFSPKNGLK
jgi:hypothetical protein